MSLSLLPVAIGGGLVTASILSLSALGFNLTVAVSNVWNVGFVAFMTVGEFVGLWADQWSHSLVVAALVAAVAAGGLGLVLYAIILPFQRRRVQTFVLALVTFAFATVVDSGIAGIVGEQQHALNVSSGLRAGVSFLGLGLTVVEVITIGLTAALVIAFDALLRWTKLGREIRAIADDEGLARTAGVNVTRISGLVWFLAGVLGSVAGIMLAVAEASFSANTATQGYFVLLIAAAILGGAGKPYGAVAGALIIGMVVNVTSIWINPQLTPLIGFGALILVVIFRPTGILGGRTALRA